MICIVDFDGTLFKNDFFLEVFFKTMVERPFYLFKVCVSKKFNLIDILAYSTLLSVIPFFNNLVSVAGPEYSVDIALKGLASNELLRSSELI